MYAITISTFTTPNQETHRPITPHCLRQTPHSPPTLSAYFSTNTYSSSNTRDHTTIAMTTDKVAPDVMRPITLLLLSQIVLFLGVGAVIPTILLYGQNIGLSLASNSIVISAPALALMLIVNRAAEGYADMMGGMAIIALTYLGTAYSSNLVEALKLDQTK